MVTTCIFPSSFRNTANWTEGLKCLLVHINVMFKWLNYKSTEPTVVSNYIFH